MWKKIQSNSDQRQPSDTENPKPREAFAQAIENGGHCAARCGVAGIQTSPGSGVMKQEIAKFKFLSDLDSERPR